MTSRNCRRAAGLAAIVVGVFVTAAGSGTAVAQSADTLAKRLATLRAEVEGLSEDLARAKTDTRNELASLARQKSDLRVELDRERTRVAKLRAALGKKRERVAATSAQGDDLEPVFELAAEGIKGYIASSLPFRTEQRLAEVDKLVEQRRTGALTYPRALVRLWGLVEDEFRMTRESALYQQTIVVDGQDKLAQVVRVGMVMLFYQASSGEVGYAQRPSSTWEFTVASGTDHKKQIRTLFENFKKQIRVGLFTVPNTLAGGGQ